MQSCEREAGAVCCESVNEAIQKLFHLLDKCWRLFGQLRHRLGQSMIDLDITSAQFAEIETIDRQSLIGDIVETHFSPEERRRVLVIVGVTPDEGTGYLAGEE